MQRYKIFCSKKETVFFENIVLINTIVYNTLRYVKNKLVIQMQIPDFSQIEVKDYKPVERTLDNGIKTYCFRNNDSEAVFMKFVFHDAGTISQDKFFEAALVKTQLGKNTRDYSFKELSEEMDFYGLSYSPVTTSERTTLNFSFLSRYTKEIIPILQQMIVFPHFKEDTLKITVSNARQNYMIKMQQSSFLAQKYYMQELFGEDNPYGKFATVEDYAKVTAEDLKNFWQKHYSSSKCYILLAGDIDEEFYSLLNKYLGVEFNAENSEKMSRTIGPFKESKGIVKNTLASAVQSSVVIGRLMPKINHEDFIPLSVLNCLLGGYFNSRLMSNIREEKGYTYGIDSRLAPFGYGSMMMILSDVAADKTDLTIKEVWKEMEILQSEQVSKEELSMVKNYMTGDLIRANDGVAEISENYDYIIRYGLRKDYNTYMTNEIRKTTAQTIQHLAQKYLNKKDFLVSVVGKE